MKMDEGQNTPDSHCQVDGNKLQESAWEKGLGFDNTPDSPLGKYAERIGGEGNDMKVHDKIDLQYMDNDMYEVCSTQPNKQQQ